MDPSWDYGTYSLVWRWGLEITEVTLMGHISVHLGRGVDDQGVIHLVTLEGVIFLCFDVEQRERFFRFSWDISFFFQDVLI